MKAIALLEVQAMVAAITGLAAILHASATAFTLIKYAGVAYLLYMAWNTLKENGALRVDETQPARTPGRIVIEAVLIKEGFSENYYIKLGRVNNNDTFDVYVELPPEKFDDSVKAIAEKEKQLALALRAMIGIGPAVHLVPPKTIQRSEGKAKRVIDERNLI